MWTVDNHTPYAARGAWGRDKDGVHEWIVAVKGTFSIRRDGQLTLADEQPEPLMLPEYSGEDGVSSLKYDADLVGPKPTTDLVVNGTAYVPNGRPASQFPISLRLGAISKVVNVIGHRVWKPGLLSGSQSAAEPVVAVPVVYERAFGGFDRSNPDPKHQRMDVRNPVGCGLVTQVGQSLPNFVYPGERIDKAGPAGFGAIPSYWSPRRELAGTYDDAWKKGRFPLLPTDWSPNSLLCSPADQRPPKPLDGGELVELTNLTPNGALRFALPRVRLAFRTTFSTGLGVRRVEHASRLATVIVEPDQMRVILVWQSVLVCRTDVDYLEETRVSEGANP